MQIRTTNNVAAYQCLLYVIYYIAKPFKTSAKRTGGNE